MLLSKSFLNEQVQKKYLTENVLFSARQKHEQYDLFISYSWNDKSYADKVVQLLEKCGYTVYIDYNDNRLDRSNVSEETAKRLIVEMKKCKGLLHLYSPSASVSKWCPWEVGIFSGFNDFMCANLPLVDNQGDSFKKQEYLEIYPHVEYAKDPASKNYDFWICESSDKYIVLKEWLKGKKPITHK